VHDDRIKRPAYQWYVGDARNDEIFMLMSYEQQGIYRALLDHQWIEGSLPADPNDIARLLPKLSPLKFRRHWDQLISVKFLQKPDGRWINAKLEKQRELLDQYIEEKRKRGQNGGRRKADNLAAASLVLADTPKQNPSSSSSSSSSSEKQESAHTRTPDRSLTRTTAPIIAQSAHRNHAYCGVVCLPSAMCDDFIARSRHRPDPRAYVSAFFDAWNDRYFSGDRKDVDISGDAFDFWRKRWKETHPETEQKTVVDMTAKALERITANEARYGKR
jgi:uncharacterized protein YdaU (DUF1376 family)